MPIATRLLPTFCLGLLLSVVTPLVTQSPAATAADPPRRSFIAADSSRQRIAIINEDGNTRWEHRIGPLHDLHVLPSGNVLLQLNWTHVAELSPDTGKIVWEYDAARQPDNQARRVEIHAFQRTADGNTLIAESGPARLLLLAPDHAVKATIPLQVAKPDPHHDTRLVRALQNGNFLVCHEAEGLVREYRPNGSTAWEYQVPLFGRERRPGHGVDAFGNQVFSALRLQNGNTLVGTGNGHSVIEVTPAGQVVWSLHQNELPGIQLAWVTSLQVLPSGNILINNCHAGPGNPQLIEVSREKRVVWSFRDFDRFGDSTTNSQILSVDGQTLSGTLR
jgi:outer membrane protein assembly factor BamB